MRLWQSSAPSLGLWVPGARAPGWPLMRCHSSWPVLHSTIVNASSLPCGLLLLRGPDQTSQHTGFQNDGNSQGPKRGEREPNHLNVADRSRETANTFGHIRSTCVSSSGIRSLGSKYTCVRALSLLVRGDVKCKKPLTTGSVIKNRMRVKTLKIYSLKEFIWRLSYKLPSR